MTPDPKVSVVIPTYNRAALLPRAVNSVLAQTFTDFELIILDDASPDRTPQVAAAFSDHRVRHVRHDRNRGLAGARNTGVAQSRGRYVAFLDDDDEFLPQKLERQVRALDDAPPQVGMAYVQAEYVGPDGQVERTLRHTAEGDLFNQVLALDLGFSLGSTAMFRANIFPEIGGFDETLAQGEDLDFTCVLARRYRIACVPRVLTRLHIGHPRMSSPTRRTLLDRRDHLLHHQSKFRAELAVRRRTRAAIHRRLAAAEMRVGQRRRALRAIAAAMWTDPATAWYAARWLLRPPRRRT